MLRKLIIHAHRRLLSPLFFVYGAIGERRLLLGFDVAVMDNAEERLRKLEAALSLLEKVSPWRLARLQHNVDRIFIAELGAPVSPGRRWIMLSGDALDSQSADWIASTLVFGSVLALLRNRAMGTEGFRVLRLCHEEQVAFARRVPEGYLLLETLTQAWDHGWWTERNHRATQEEVMEAGDLPNWMRSFLRWVTK